jgi:hypothetical protein
VAQHSSVPTCRGCGCTDDRACPGGCYWVDDDLCSRCDEIAGAADDDVLDSAGDAEACPANPFGVHQVLWTDDVSGYCVRCRTPVHA